MWYNLISSGPLPTLKFICMSLKGARNISHMILLCKVIYPRNSESSEGFFPRWKPRWTEPSLKQDLSENLCIITLDMYIFVDILLKMLLLYRYFLETYPFIKLFFYWNWFFFLILFCNHYWSFCWDALGGTCFPDGKTFRTAHAPGVKEQSGWIEKLPSAGWEPSCSRRKEVP